jgi:hypothetical protein
MRGIWGVYSPNLYYSDDVKSEVIPFRLPITEAAALREEAKLAGRSLSDLIRERIQNPAQQPTLEHHGNEVCTGCHRADMVIRQLIAVSKPNDPAGASEVLSAIHQLVWGK